VIAVKNTSGKTLKNITVVDRVPKAINKPTEFGAYKPENIDQMGEGVRMVWNIPTLRSGQERIISYKVSSHINIAKAIGLPETIARVRTNTRSFRATSNKATLKTL
jgi:hypothetical protein